MTLPGGLRRGTGAGRFNPSDSVASPFPLPY
ncbi:hypothetical protein GGQ96_000558 [Sphingomonas abaci]|uniref:Uncharacterized protein n=1 Tax=Sphingomonas abaci TaxID=237611 RepID=A0A7W7AI44_9SPHN|nr:hypothetical protein [Sphingomonas abaci]